MTSTSNAHAYGGQYLRVSYRDAITPQHVETKTVDEIVNDVVTRGGITLL